MGAGGSTRRSQPVSKESAHKLASELIEDIFDAHADKKSGHIPQEKWLKLVSLSVNKLSQEAKPLDAAVARATKWAACVGCVSAEEVNSKVAADCTGAAKTVLLAEAWHDSQIVAVANAIRVKREATAAAATPLSLVLIAGPSSSGKTTFCSKLAIHLRCAGIRPETLSTDDYYLARNDPKHPRSEDGSLNFECIEAVDVERLNTDLALILAGETVETPIFDFKLGKHEASRTRRKSLAKGGVLLMEGIFCLNPRLTPQIARAAKFNVFIAPLSPLRLKDGSIVREDYLRLVRRISRDFLHRGNSALRTVRKYDSVRKGELANIFPFVSEADVIFNSSLLYETHVLKTTVKPQLQQISKEEAGATLYALVDKLLVFLGNFEEVDASSVPQTSVLMEFIGKSAFA